MTFRSLILAALLIGAAFLPAFAADNGLAGNYDVQGWEPEGDRASAPDYTGTITITKFGEAYKLSGQMDGESYSGIGFKGEDGQSFSFAYRGSEGDTGLSVGYYRNGIWLVYWIDTETKSGRPGQEVWAKRPDSAPQAPDSGE